MTNRELESLKRTVQSTAKLINRAPLRADLDQELEAAQAAREEADRRGQ